MVGKTSISGTKNPAATGSGVKSREKRRESFAASKAYDISTRQVVAIHTQLRGKAAAPLAMARETARRQSPQKSRKSGR
jgi:hypothetical protein